MRLGSAVPSVQAQQFLGKGLMSASGPHWCADPVLDMNNEVFQTFHALVRIRRSCPTLRTAADHHAAVGDGPEEGRLLEAPGGLSPSAA